jgi:hypothetical protein
MLMVILGAGASFDSASLLHPSTPCVNRPPLADQLFDNRPMFRAALMKYRPLQPIMTYLGNRHGRSVEEVLQGLSEESPRVAERARQLMAARYYIREIIHDCCKEWLKEVHGITTHKTFVDQILECESQRVLFVTFNYDTLVEDVLSDHNLSIKGFEDYTYKSAKFTLYKLHGSIDWVRAVHLGHEGIPARSLLIDEVARLADKRPGAEFKIHRNIAGDIVDEVFVGIPAIAIPINRKLIFECPEQHIRHLCQMLPQVTKILVIGWQGTESTFIDLLKKHLRPIEKLRVVSAADAPKVMNHLRTTLSPILDATDCESFDRGFTQFISERDGVPFLKAH